MSPPFCESGEPTGTTKGSLSSQKWVGEAHMGWCMSEAEPGLPLKAPDPHPGP